MKSVKNVIEFFFLNLILSILCLVCDTQPFVLITLPNYLVTFYQKLDHDSATRHGAPPSSHRDGHPSQLANGRAPTTASRAAATFGGNINDGEQPNITATDTFMCFLQLKPTSFISFFIVGSFNLFLLYQFQLQLQSTQYFFFATKLDKTRETK